MTRKISFALGNIWRWSEVLNRNDLISYVRKFGITGVEITFSSKEEVYAFKLSKDNEKWLKKLDYVTIHAPFGLIRKADNEEEVIKQLKIIEEIYKKVNAKNVIIHPGDLPSPDILNQFNFKVSTENLPRKRKFTVSKLKEIFKKYPRIGLCLDVAHAYTWSKYETSRLVEAFEERITQIHFSGTYRKKDHQSLRDVSEDFMYSIEPIFKLNVPIVIEEDMEGRTEKFLVEEIEFIRKMFGE